MNFRDLKYLVAIADLKHFGKAAESCHVSQPALSIQLKKLEDFLGVSLFERNNKSVVLTDGGAEIVERAREILKHVSELEELAQSFVDPFSGEFKLGILPTLAPYLLPLIITPLSTHYPKIKFHLLEEKTSALTAALASGKIHAALLALPINDKGLTYLPIFEEDFVLAVPHQHPLAKKTCIEKNDILKENVLLMDEGHCMSDQTSWLCNLLDSSQTNNFRATSLETLRHMISSGAGVSLMPMLSSRGCDLATFIPLRNPQLSRKIVLTYRNTSSKKDFLQHLANKIQNILQNYTDFLKI